MTATANSTPTWTQCPKCSSILEVLAVQLSQADGWVQCAQCNQTFLALSSEIAFNPHLHTPTHHDTTDQIFNSSRFTSTENSLTESASEHAHSHFKRDGSELKPQLIAFDNADGRAVGTFGEPLAHAHPRLGVIMGLLTAALGLMGLFSIMVYQNRNILASWAPELKPPLMKACAMLSCQIDWPMDLSALSIEMSGFEHDSNDPNLYTLSLKLKNSNSYTVAAPRVRLMVMNDKDQTLLSQSLALSKPEEPRVVHPGSLNQWIIAVQLTPPLNQVPNGYRLELENP